MSHITAVVWYTICVDETSIQTEERSQRKRSHIICKLMATEKGLSSEEQAYYAHSMNTMCVVKDDRLFSENDKL